MNLHATQERFTSSLWSLISREGDTSESLTDKIDTKSKVLNSLFREPRPWNTDYDHDFEIIFQVQEKSNKLIIQLIPTR